MFTWKRHKDIFKGEGVYHLTFVVHDRAPILGALAGDASAARVELSPIGYDISQNIQQLPSFFPAIKVCAKLLMPDHIHVVLWVQKEHPYSIKQVGRSMRQAWHKIILAHTQEHGNAASSINPQIKSAGDNKNESTGEHKNENTGEHENENTGYNKTENTGDNKTENTGYNKTESIGEHKNESTGYNKNENTGDNKTESIGEHENENTLHLPYRFEPPYIRTLVAKEQLNRMIAYIHDNPHRAMLRRLNPDLFRLRRELQVEGLTFTALGNLFLLDYPQRQAIECSRSASEEQVAALQASAMQAAEDGAVSYSGAISAGEKQIVRAIHEADMPIVVVLNDGFPAAGSEHERFYKPGGVYFEACAAGRLLLLEPTATTLESERVVSQTEQALRNKAEAKHQDYIPLPHASKRWRMVANNCIAEILANRDS